MPHGNQDVLSQGANRVADSLARGLDRLLQEYRTEVMLLAIVGGAFAGMYQTTHKSAIAAGAITTSVIILLAFIRPVRHRVCHNLKIAKVRRRWDRTTSHCGFGHVIPMTEIQPVAVGYTARIRVGHGIAFPDLGMRREKLAAGMRAREVILRRDDHDAATGTVTIVRKSPPAHQNPWHEVAQIEQDGPIQRLEDPHPLGTSGHHGEIVSLVLVERGLLVGGMPDTGKSHLLHLVTAWAALDPTVHLHLIDYKRVEMARWRRCADHFGRTPVEAVAILAELDRMMMARYEQMERDDLTNVRQRPEDFPLHFLAVDELMPYTDNSDRALKGEFNGHLQNIAALGRAAGIIPVLATQKPHSSVVPTQIRDVIPYRLAFNCATRQASDTILGADYAAAGYDAATLGIGHPGLGLLLEETNVPEQVQVFYQGDDGIRALAGRAEATRRRHLQGAP